MPGLLIEGVGHLEQHGVERARFFADLDHLQGQSRHHFAMPERDRQTIAGLDRLGGFLDRSRQHPIADHLAGDVERRQQRYAVAEQGAECACEPSGFHPGQHRPDPALGQQAGVETQPPFRLLPAAIQPQPDHGQDADDQPEIVADDHAQAEHDLRDQRQLDAGIVEHGLELRYHVGQHDDQGERHHRHQDGRVDHGIDDTGAQCLAAFEVVGQPGQGDLQAATGLAGPDQIDVELREQAVLLFQGAGQRRTAANRFPHPSDHPPGGL